MSVKFRHGSGAYADLNAGGACIGILTNDDAKMGIPVELIDREVRAADRQCHNKDSAVDVGPALWLHTCHSMRGEALSMECALGAS